jgi:hypothetical protein
VFGRSVIVSKTNEELRDTSRDRERLAEAERKVGEVKIQAAQELGRVAEQARRYAEEAQSENEKRQGIELGERLDPQTAEFLACPRCGIRMGIPEHPYPFTAGKRTTFRNGYIRNLIQLLAV